MIIFVGANPYKDVIASCKVVRNEYNPITMFIGFIQQQKLFNKNFTIIIRDATFRKLHDLENSF